MTETWEHIDDAACRRFQSSLELVGQRWSSGILLALARGATRFSELLELVPGLSGRLLTARLRQLTDAGLVTRSVIPTTPVQVRYELTERGRELMDALQALVSWGARWESEQASTTALSRS